MRPNFDLRGDLDPDAAAALPEAELTERPSVRAHLPPGTVASLVAASPAGEAELEPRRAAAQNLLASARNAIAQAGRA